MREGIIDIFIKNLPVIEKVFGDCMAPNIGGSKN
jgi:hypothetical protein